MHHKSLEILPVVLGPPVEGLGEGLVGPEVAREVRLEGGGLLEGDLGAGVARFGGPVYSKISEVHTHAGCSMFKTPTSNVLEWKN